MPATRQPSTSLSIILNKDAEGSPSRWRVPLLPGLLNTPSQVCLPLHDTLIPLSHFLHEWERLPGVSLWVLRTIRTGYTLQFGKNPPTFRWGSPDSSKQCLQGLCSTTGTFLPPTERSNRGSTAVGSRTRVLQPLLPRSKEGQRLEAYSGSTAFEFFPLQREVQDADDENHHVSGPGGRLVCHHRPEGCVFSHPGRSKTQEVPSVCLWREGLSIQGSALRPGFGAEDVYQMHGCCTDPFEAPGHSCTELSGRLAHSGSLQGTSESSQGYRSRPHPFSWPQDERQEECAPPISANHVSRGSFGFRSDAGPFGSCPDTRSYSMSGPLQARPSCVCRYLPQAVGPHGSGLPCVRGSQVYKPLFPAFFSQFLDFPPMKNTFRTQ